MTQLVTPGGGAVSTVFGRSGAVVAATGDYNGVVATALTGATAATRYVGGTSSGAPSSGTFAVGDFVIDQTGKVWICTSAGTPGTWAAPGSAVIPGQLIATKVYAPGSRAVYSPGSTLAALDTTNLTLGPFTIPASGNVDVMVQITTEIKGPTNSYGIAIGLLNHSGGAQLGYTTQVNEIAGAATGEEDNQINSTVVFPLTGLTAGNSLQVDLAATVAGSGTGNVFAMGPTGNNAVANAGPAIMKAYAA